MQLTPEQQAAFDLFKKFIDDTSTNVLIIKGQAGTGKTVLLNVFYEYLSNKLSEALRIAKEKSEDVNIPQIYIAAPTGKAAQNITQRHKLEALTIHKTIYSNTDIRHKEIIGEDGTKTYKFYYDIQKTVTRKFLLIDEASMISDREQQNEFFSFGSGKLLEDLIQYASFEENSKLILFGDHFQLPPINMNFSPAIDKQYLHKKYQLTTKIYELNEVLRQKQNSGIIQLATNIRKSLNNNDFNKLEIPDADDLSIIDNEEQILTTYLELYKKDGQQIKIITETNKRAYELNQTIRKLLFSSDKNLYPNEKLLVTKNLYYKGIDLFNGEEVIIKNVAKEKEIYPNLTIKDRIAGKTENVTLIFRDLDIILPDGQTVTSIKIIENLLYSQNRELSSAEERALYKLFFIKNPLATKLYYLIQGKKFLNHNKALQLLKNFQLSGELDDKTFELIKEEIKKQKNKKEINFSVLILGTLLKNDPYFNALRVKFSHAITCHKAQGSEWDNIIVDAQFSQNYMTKRYFQWLYTATTRAKKQLYIANFPSFSEKVYYIDKQDIENIKIPDYLQFENEFQKALYTAISKLLENTETNIFSLKHHAWQEEYNLTNKKTGESSKIQIYYNKTNKITSISITGNNNLKSFLSEIEGKIIYVPISDTISDYHEISEDSDTSTNEINQEPQINFEDLPEYSLQKAQAYQYNSLFYSITYDEIKELVAQQKIYEAYKVADHYLHIVNPEDEHFALLGYLRVISNFITLNTKAGQIQQALIWLEHWFAQKIIYYDEYLANSLKFAIKHIVNYIVNNKQTSYVKQLLNLLKTSEHSRPSAVHSLILEEILNLKKINVYQDIYDFLNWWDFNNLRDEDHRPREIGDKKINSLAEAAYNTYGKVLMSLNNVNLNDVKYLEDLFSKHPDYIWLPYYIAKIYINLNRKDLAYNYFSPIAIQKGQTDWWVWSTLAEIVDERELKIYAYSKALLFNVPEKNLVKVYFNLAQLLAGYNNQTTKNYAKTLALKSIEVRNKNKWKIPYELEEFTRQSWFKQARQVDMSEIKKKLLISKGKEIVSWLYDNAQGIKQYDGIVTNITDDKNPKKQIITIQTGKKKTKRLKTRKNYYKISDFIKIYIYNNKIVFHKHIQYIATDFVKQIKETVKNDGRHLYVEYQKQKFIIPKHIAEQENIQPNQHVKAFAVYSFSQKTNSYFWKVIKIEKL